MLRRDIRYQAAIVRDHHVLLLRVVERDGSMFWLPPGGGREGEETEAACVRRELEKLRAELGYSLLSIDLSGREKANECKVRQRERRCAVTVRDAIREDAAEIAWVHGESYRTAHRGLMPEEYLARRSHEQRRIAWERILGREDSTKCICVAEDQSGKLVGFAVGGPERTGDPDYQGELEALYILPTHQRRGIGCRLICWVAERLAQAGMHSMLAWTLAEGSACGFYEALGGHRIREATRDFGGTELLVVAYGWIDTRVLLRWLGRLNCVR